MKANRHKHQQSLERLKPLTDTTPRWTNRHSLDYYSEAQAGTRRDKTIRAKYELSSLSPVCLRVVQVFPLEAETLT